MCAIHQPNLFPRLSTLAKLYAADRWIVLDDVQFARRDYQHRARLASLRDPRARQWLSLSTHLPRGRPTLILEARLAEPHRCRRRVAELVRQHNGCSHHWHAVQEVLDPVLERFGTTDHTADITEASSLALLSSLGWRGEVLRSSALPARDGRSQRLADLAAATGSTVCLCGTGGMRYLEVEAFTEHRITVVPFRTPVVAPVWQFAREVSALWALASIGPSSLAEALRSVASAQQGAAEPHA
ncbi:WbqC-like protein family protein [Streptomyces sp. MnatMP-M27]|uniref:WbqC family protein n=1 Tax=Streptomyces sp. MnatMP-M27 TaxID=1839768 RepID=UPI00081DD693|nr:WbqC family protein [Streptomyces sp. MnatMP-M27]SCF82877.1 WbqC-like protein family protein [Streptomyces sp. MnatMP-M27]